MRGEKFILMDGKGFSLIELLVAMAMSGLVAMAAYTVFSTSNWSSAVQEQVSEAQQNVRVAMDRLSADIRVAGFGLPDPPFSLDFNGNAFTGPITITNSSTDPDTITVLGIGFEAAALENDADNNGTVDDADCNGSGDNFICLDSVTNTNNFYNDDQSAFLAVRRHVSLDGVRYFQLDTVGHDRANKKLKLVDSTFLDRDCRDGVKVYVLQAVRYAIATDLEGCSAANPCRAAAPREPDRSWQRASKTSSSPIVSTAARISLTVLRQTRQTSLLYGPALLAERGLPTSRRSPFLPARPWRIALLPVILTVTEDVP
jgi:prepilin-type N-terminal cleavage/methylation domain-containing protein